MANSDFNKLAVLIEANTKQYENAMKKLERQTGQAFKSVRKDVSKAQKAFDGLNQQIAKNAAKWDRIFAATFGTASVVAFSKSILTAASDAQELDSKFRAVFGRMADETEAWAETTGEAVGRSSLELKEYLSTLQDTFVPLGFAREKAADLSKQLALLGIDVASFTNASEPETINAFTSAIVGNHEAVRRFGIVITEARLNTELLNMGIKGGTRGATEQEKVLARLNIILNSTKDAQGDAARTSDSFANKTRALSGAWREFKAELGLFLAGPGPGVLSFLTEGTRLATQFFERFGEAGARSIASIDMEISELEATLSRLQSGETSGQYLPGFLQDLVGFDPDELTKKTREQIQSLKQLRAALSDLDENGPSRSRVFDLPSGDKGDKNNNGSKTTTPIARALEETGQAATIATPAVDEYTEALVRLSERNEALRDIGSNALSGLLRDLAHGRDAATSFENALQSLADRLIDMAIQNLVGAIFGGGMGGGLGGLLGGFGGFGMPVDPWAGLRVPGLADGGPVSGGKPYIVGERGPELMIPKSSGNIIPNHALGGGGNMQVIIENHTGQPVRQQQGSRGGVDFRRIIIGEVNKAAGGGEMDKSLGGRFGVRPQALPFG
ncbi:MAG: hypothetical protein R3D35_05240 [Nitratireductor sp.]